jgi:hypothetical protein
MLVYTKTCVVAPSFLFTVGSTTGVIVTLLALPGLTRFLSLYMGHEHSLHEGHTLIAPKLLVGFLGLRWFTCCHPKRLTIPVLVMALQGIEGLVRAAVGFAMLAKLLTASVLRNSINQAPRRFFLGITCGIRTGCALALPFALSFLFSFSTMTHLIASKSSRNARVNLGIMRWVRLYWFCHIIGTDTSTIVARSALTKRMFPFFVLGTALGLSCNVGR